MGPSTGHMTKMGFTWVVSILQGLVVVGHGGAAACGGAVSPWGDGREEEKVC